MGVTLRLLVNERELLNIRKGFDIRRLHAGFVKGPLVVRRMVIGKLYHFLEVPQLSLLQFLSRERLQLLIPVLAIYISAHDDRLHLMNQY